MAELVYVYHNTSKENEPYYRDEGFDTFISIIKRHFDNGNLIKFTRTLKKGTEEFRMEFDTGTSAIDFETEIEDWFQADDLSNQAKHIQRIKGQCTY